MDSYIVLCCSKLLLLVSSNFPEPFLCIELDLACCAKKRERWGICMDEHGWGNIGIHGPERDTVIHTNRILTTMT